eukprot:COSAG01_NODE_412_length_17370_cov_26.910196_2_plen_268_part_00
MLIDKKLQQFLKDNPEEARPFSSFNYNFSLVFSFVFLIIFIFLLFFLKMDVFIRSVAWVEKPYPLFIEKFDQQAYVKELSFNVNQHVKAGDVLFYYLVKGVKRPYVSLVSGCVREVFIQPGDYLDVGQAMFALESEKSLSSDFELHLFLDANQSVKVDLDLPVYIDFSRHLAKRYVMGKVSYISPESMTAYALKHMNMPDKEVKQLMGQHLLKINLSKSTDGAYIWADQKGGALKLMQGQRCELKILLDRISVKDLMVSFLRDLWLG